MGLVAPPLVKRAFGASFVVLAAAVLLLAAFRGGDERRSLTRFEPAGPLRATDSASVRVIEVRKGEQRWRFERAGSSWQAAQSTTPAQLRALEEGLTLLRNAAPERRFDDNARPDDVAAGLAPAQLSVRIEAASNFAIEFGAPNPIGLARYARIAGDPATLLLPRYVADTWEAAVGLRDATPAGGR